MQKFEGLFPPRPKSSQDIMELQELLAEGEIADVNLGDDDYLHLFGKLRSSDTRTFIGIEKEVGDVPAYRPVTYHRQGRFLVRVIRNTDVWLVVDTWDKHRWCSIQVVRRDIDMRVSNPSEEAVDAMYKAALEATRGLGSILPQDATTGL